MVDPTPRRPNSSTNTTTGRLLPDTSPTRNILEPSGDEGTIFNPITQDLIAAMTNMLSKQQELADQISTLSALVFDQASQIESLRVQNTNLQQFIHHTTGQDGSSPTRIHSPPTKRNKTESDSLSDTAKHYMANLNVLFTVQTVIDEVPGLQPPTLTAQGLQLIAADSNARFSILWKAMHNSAKMIAMEQNISLSLMASSKFLVSTPLIKKMFTGGMSYEPLGCLASLECWKLDSQDFLKFKNQDAWESQSDSHYSSDSIHATKRELTMFYQVNFDKTVDSILACVANFIVVASTLVYMSDPWRIHEGNPLIINNLLELSLILSSSDTKMRLMSATNRHPHILFIVFSYFQDLFSEMGRILMKDRTRDIALAMMGNDSFLFDSSLFEGYYTQFEVCKTELSKLVKTCSPPQAPMGYYIIHPPVETKPQINTAPAPPNSLSATPMADYNQSKQGKGTKWHLTYLQAMNVLAQHQSGSIPIALPTVTQVTTNSNSTPTTEPKGDWLEMSAGVTLKDLFPLPKGVHFCAHHAVKGIRCGLSRCKYPHIHYSGFDPASKVILDTHLASVNQTTQKFKVVQ